MAVYAQVVVDLLTGKLDRPFTYRVPARLQSTLRPGALVQVPFGRGSRLRRGYVVELTDHADLEEGRIKEIDSLVDLGKDYTADDEEGEFYIRLAAWMRRMYGATMLTALRTVLSSRRSGKAKKVREIVLLLDREEGQEKLALYTRKHQVARARLLEALLQTPRLPYSLVTGKLHVSAQTIRGMEQKGVLRIEESQTLRNPVSFGEVGEDRLVLSPAQQAVVDGVLADFSGGHPGISLIHGITGSGKTEVYISIIRRIVEQGRQAIMLIPEISLTYQTLLRFYRHFGDRVSVVNSQLSEAERADQWERARRGEIDVIIGPRSALFTPFSRLGVIVIDEEHEGSYKNEQMPKYQTREVAAKIAQMRGAVLVLGSATPSLDAYYRAQQGRIHLYHLTERLTGGTLPHVQIADMREEMKSGNRSIFSRRLQELIAERLDNHEQIILFLNRRGFSGYVSCRSCGHVIQCPHCDVALSLHADGRLHCHYCGYTTPMVQRCPECGSPYVAGFRAGTEQIVDVLQRMVPKARILRMDADTTAKKGDYERILTTFANEEADILVGTQMIVKGHDFPKVTLVGILLADLSLYAGDYRSAERTFQLLTQAAGRAGRGERPGEVVIQTYQPDNYAIVHAARQDYEGFYEEEIQYRRLLHYPPVWHMLCVQVTGKNEDRALSLVGQIRDLLLRENPAPLVIGPSDARIRRIQDNYRFAVYIKEENYAKLIRYKDDIEAFLAATARQGGRSDVLVQFDFNPASPF